MTTTWLKCALWGINSLLRFVTGDANRILVWVTPRTTGRGGYMWIASIRTQSVSGQNSQRAVSVLSYQILGGSLPVYPAIHTVRTRRPSIPSWRLGGASVLIMPRSRHRPVNATITVAPRSHRPIHLITLSRQTLVDTVPNWLIH